MSKARDLANLMSTGSIFSDGAIAPSEITGVTADATELNKLDGVTASTAELNKLDGVTASTAEINKLAGVTASTAEINKLTGVTASTTEINRVVGVTSDIQTQLNAKAASSSLGSAAALDVGTGANNIPQLDSNGKLGAIDGSQLTGIQGFSYASTLAFGDY